VSFPFYLQYREVIFDGSKDTTTESLLLSLNSASATAVLISISQSVSHFD